MDRKKATEEARFWLPGLFRPVPPSRREAVYELIGAMLVLHLQVFYDIVWGNAGRPEIFYGIFITFALVCLICFCMRKISKNKTLGYSYAVAIFGHDYRYYPTLAIIIVIFLYNFFIRKYDSSAEPEAEVSEQP